MKLIAIDQSGHRNIENLFRRKGLPPPPEAMFQVLNRFQAFVVVQQTELKGRKSRPEIKKELESLLNHLSSISPDAERTMNVACEILSREIDGGFPRKCRSGSIKVVSDLKAVLKVAAQATSGRGPRQWNDKEYYAYLAAIYEKFSGATATSTPAAAFSDFCTLVTGDDRDRRELLDIAIREHLPSIRQVVDQALKDWS